MSFGVLVLRLNAAARGEGDFQQVDSHGNVWRCRVDGRAGLPGFRLYSALNLYSPCRKEHHIKTEGENILEPF